MSTVAAYPSDSSAAPERLAAEVMEIAYARNLGRPRKEKQIAEAVRRAISTETARQSSPTEIAHRAHALGTAAARSAPEFADVIANAVIFAPAMSRVSGASDRLRFAIYAASRQSLSAGPTGSGDATVLPRSRPVAAPLNKNTSWVISATTSVHRDNNVYLDNANRVSETIVAVTPGVEFRFGQQSLIHGSIGARTAFTEYLDNKAPNSRLATLSADAGYENDRVTVSANGAFRQIEQNTGQTSGLNAKAIFRRDVTSAGSTVLTKMTDRTGVQTGFNLEETRYKTAGLVGSREVSLPAKVYVEATPKLNVLAGVTYGRSAPQNGGPVARDVYYNTGITGNLTPTLTAQLSAGYRTRAVAGSEHEHMFGFDGLLGFAPTLKTRLSLTLSRNFGTGALGESLRNTDYSLGIVSNPAPHWSFSGALVYRDVAYGAPVFAPALSPATLGRHDRYWESNWAVTYLFTQWFSASFDATFRRNDSSQSRADFTDSILGFSLAFQY